MSSGALLVAALALPGGCSTTIADLPAVGTPADAPERPREAGAYLPVHDLPPDRVDAIIAPAERSKIEAELVAARERQAAATDAKDSKAKPGPKPAAKSRSEAKSKARAVSKPDTRVEAKAEQKRNEGAPSVIGNRAVTYCWRNRAPVLKETPQPQIWAGIAALASKLALND